MFSRLFICLGFACSLAVSVPASDLCSFQPSETAQRTVNMRGIYNTLKLFADTSTSHTPPLVPDSNEQSFDPIPGLEATVDTVVLKLLVHPSGIVLDAKLTKPGKQEMSECLAYQWASTMKFVPAYKDNTPVAAWRMVVVDVAYGGDSVEVLAKPDSGAVLLQSHSVAELSDNLQDAVNTLLPDTIAQMTHEVQPDYPRAASLAGIQGQVVIKALVDTEGKVKDALVLQSSGHKILDDAALAVAPRNRFKPAVKDGHPVAMWVAYMVTFGLDER